MAAQSVVRRGYDDPIETYSSNVMGTVHVFEAIRQLGRPCVVVNVTSDKCYENREWHWGYRESEPMGGRDPYSNSKGCAELVTTSYRESFFAPHALDQHGVALGSARAGNAIGGGDWTSNQLIPDLMRAFLARRACLIRSPSAIRPWQFVLEPLRGYLMLAERLATDGAGFASGWNFGPAEADAKPVSWIADELVRSWGKGAAWDLDAGTASTRSSFPEARRLASQSAVELAAGSAAGAGAGVDRRMVPRVRRRVGPATPDARSDSSDTSRSAATPIAAPSIAVDGDRADLAATGRALKP